MPTVAANVITGRTPRSVRAVMASVRVTEIHLLYLTGLNVWFTTRRVIALPNICPLKSFIPIRKPLERHPGAPAFPRRPLDDRPD